MVEEFVTAGRVRFVYRHYAFLGRESVRAAEAAECAAEQGRFWEYHDTLFSNWGGENRGAFSDDRLKRFAAALGLDREKFNSCLDSGRYSYRVGADNRDAQVTGVRGTPTVFVNNTQVGNPLDYSQLRRAILAALPR
ncbi:MAG: thioredoxin domain-containing protein [Chloroflexi bacterium]|nr:thioredoxin domain-containing protein [Chloroflexota bacterium]